MPKSEFIDPNVVRQPGCMLKLQPIPLNQYQKTVKDEREKLYRRKI